MRQKNRRFGADIPESDRAFRLRFQHDLDCGDGRPAFGGPSIRVLLIDVRDCVAYLLRMSEETQIRREGMNEFRSDSAIKHQIRDNIEF
jgi:hypothetical protein